MTWRWAYFIEVMLDWLLPELWPFNKFSAVSLVSTTPPTVFKGFWWNFPVIVPMTWRCAYYTQVTLDRFLPELWPFVSFSLFFSTEVLVSGTPPTVFKGFWWNFPDIVPMTWRCACFIEVMLDWFLPELWPFNNFSAVSLVSAIPPTVFKGFCWNFPVIVPMTWRCACRTEVTLDHFLPELWPFVSFSHFINRSSCLSNSSYSFQGIFMKLSRYCSHGLKMRIFYRGHARLILTRVMAL